MVLNLKVLKRHSELSKAITPNITQYHLAFIIFTEPIAPRIKELNNMTQLAHGDWLAAFIGHVVVCDIGEGFTVLGTITNIAPTFIEFSDVDFHNQHEANSSRDVYTLECKQIGVRPNRKKLFVPRDRLIALSKLDDVVG